MTLCSMLQGTEYLHHSSNAYGEYAGREVEVSLLGDASTLGTYVRNYGPMAEDRVRFWPLAAQLVEDVGWSVEELNDWLDGEGSQSA